MTAVLERALLKGEKLKVRETFEMIKDILDGELEIDMEQALEEFEKSKERAWKEWKRAKAFSSCY